MPARKTHKLYIVDGSCERFARGRLTGTSVTGQTVTGLGAGRERVRAVWGYGGHGWRGHGYGGHGRPAVVVRHVVMVFRTGSGQTVSVLVVGERVLVARRHHDYGPRQVRLTLVEVVAAAVPRVALQRVRFLFLVREEFRLEICENRQSQFTHRVPSTRRVARLIRDFVKRVAKDRRTCAPSIIPDAVLAPRARRVPVHNAEHSNATDVPRNYTNTIKGLLRGGAGRRAAPSVRT